MTELSNDAVVAPVSDTPLVEDVVESPKAKAPKAKAKAPKAKKGWFKYVPSPEQQKALIPLLKSKSLDCVVRIMRAEKGPDSQERPKVFPDPTFTSKFALQRIADNYNFELFRSGNKYAGALAQYMASLVKKHGVQEAREILNNPKKAAQRNKDLCPKPMAVCYPTLRQIAVSAGVKIPVGQRGRKKGWTKFSGALAKYMGSLVRHNGVKGAKEILGNPRKAAQRNKDLCPKPLNVGSLTLRRIAIAAGVKIPVGKRGRKEGWSKYTKAQSKYMVGLVRKNGLLEAREILTSEKDSYAKLRDKKLCPDAIVVSPATLYKMASTAGVKFRRGRPAAA